MPELIAYLLDTGPLVCVDCDVHPPNSKPVYRGDSHEQHECDVCGQALRAVVPVS